MFDRSNLEEELYKLMKEYEQPVDYDFSLDDLFRKVSDVIDDANERIVIERAGSRNPELKNVKLYFQLSKEGIKKALPQIELDLVNRLIKEAADNYSIFKQLKKFGSVSVPWYHAERKIIGFLTSIGAELYCRENPGKFYIVPDGLDYVGFGAEGVKIKVRKVGDWCGSGTEDSEFDVIRTGKGFLMYADHCVGRAEFMSADAGVMARWTTITTKEAGACFLDASYHCEGFVEDWVNWAGLGSDNTRINGIKVDYPGLWMDESKALEHPFLKFGGPLVYTLPFDRLLWMSFEPED